MLRTDELRAAARAIGDGDRSGLRARLELEADRRQGHATAETRVFRITVEDAPELKHAFLEVVRECMDLAADPGNPSVCVVAEALRDRCDEIVGIDGLVVPRRIRPGCVATGSSDGNVALPELTEMLLRQVLVNVDFHEIARAWVTELTDGWIEDEDERCECGASLADGEGYDGQCGNCADRAARSISRHGRE